MSRSKDDAIGRILRHTDGPAGNPRGRDQPWPDRRTGRMLEALLFELERSNPANILLSLYDDATYEKRRAEYFTSKDKS